MLYFKGMKMKDKNNNAKIKFVDVNSKRFKNFLQETLTENAETFRKLAEYDKNLPRVFVK
jgi:hypothetical protein